MKMGVPDTEKGLSDGQLTESTRYDHSPREPTTRRMPSVRAFSLTLLLCLSVAAGFAHAGVLSGKPCHKMGTAEVEPENAATPDQSSLSRLLSSASPQALHEFLHAYLPESDQHGVFESDQAAIDAVESDDPELATSIAQVARRQAGGGNDTTAADSTTAEATPTETETSASETTTADSATTTSENIPTTTAETSPPPSTTTDITTDVATSVTTDVSTEVSTEVSTPEASTTTEVSTPTTTEATTTEAPTTDISSVDTTTTETPETTTDAAPTTSSTQSSDDSSSDTTPSTTASPSTSTSTFTSTLPGGAVTTMTSVTIVTPTAAEQQSASSTIPEGTLQTGGNLAPARGPAMGLLAGAILGGAILI
ncbi:hypothetical protein F4780DRAFT_599054 [Xylariomycetidae sp. FL0641]|nr:hypothetical protein F4780DRAFT_599054 [Xylariomycetidae sp. FL0641]